MIVYNITIKIIPAIEGAWVQWQLQEHIPAIMATGMFNEYMFYHLLEQDDEEGITYVLQFFASSLLEYERYMQLHAPLLQQQSFDKWGERYIAFRTVMETVN